MNLWAKKNKDILFVSCIFAFAKVYVLAIYLFALKFLPTHTAFVSSIRYANFDGIHYPLISENGYGEFQQAFFPLYPLLMNWVHTITGLSYVYSGLLISNISFFLFLYVFYKLLKRILNKKNITWPILFIVAFPTAFFFQAVYTESLFLFLVVLSFLFFVKNKYFFAFLIAGIASGTRVVGIFLLPVFIFSLIIKERNNITPSFICRVFVYSLLGASGLIGYMWYLGVEYSDPLLFIHSQSAFGANRSSGEIILLPQVLFRYVKILLTVHPKTLTFWISFTEVSTFLLSVFLCLFSYRTKVNRSIIAFSLLVLLFPTLSGTLSSIPRYALASIVLPIAFSLLIKKNSYRILILVCGFVIQAIFASIFFAGFFVS